MRAPGLSESGSPVRSAGTLLPATSMVAKSIQGSRLFTLPRISRPSCKETLTISLPGQVTWAFVTTRSSATKNPAPAWSPQRMPTTDGRARSAICSVVRRAGSGATGRAGRGDATAAGTDGSEGTGAVARDRLAPTSRAPAAIPDSATAENQFLLDDRRRASIAMRRGSYHRPSGCPKLRARRSVRHGRRVFSRLYAVEGIATRGGAAARLAAAM